jgi:preprotein translocase subunit SecG
MVSILLTLNAMICVALIVLILLQRSDPASGGMFGGAGGGGQAVVRNPLAKPTAILAALFLVFSVVTAIINKGGHHAATVMDTAVEGQPVLPEASIVPGAPVVAVSDTIEVPAAPAVSVTTAISPTE